MTPQPDIFFLPAPGGEQRLCVFHSPAGTPRGRVLYLHPFAEEMNKSRRMVALTCRALADAGYAVLQVDLRGCGDSSADFGDASWADWQDDVRRALDCLDARTAALPHQPHLPIWIWGLRAGALLACGDWGRAVNLLLWQPMTSGKLALQQFLRLKLAAEMASGNSKGLMDQLKAELAAGRPVEIAGYALSAALASGLEAARLQPTGATGRVEWLELSTRDDATLSPVSEQAVQQWRTAGWNVRTHLVQGPGFWASSEIETAPALIARTVEALA